MPTSSPRRVGFILVWILMTVALLAILAAVVAPSVATMYDRKRAMDASATLHQITAGIVAFENAVHSSASGSSNNYPGDVSQLAIVVGTVPDKNSCGGSFTTHDSTDWIANGPFVPMYIPTGGLWTPIGRIADDIPTRASGDAIYILIPGVDSTDAALLDQVVDHGTGDTVSALHAVINDTTTVTYRALSTGQVKNKC
jgi:type II secretory pathway pseudopilin PulG